MSFAFILFVAGGFAQTNATNVDTTSAPQSVHSPKKAALMSAIIPGAGQIYNRKYWKVPVLYAGMGTLGYFMINNRKNYIDYRNAYDAKFDTSKTDLFPAWTSEQLKQRKDYYRGNMELTVLLSVGVYLINIIDATVDAHLFGFDVSDDISMSVRPSCLCMSNRVNPALSLTFNFK